MHFWCLDINAHQIQFYTIQLVIFYWRWRFKHSDKVGKTRRIRIKRYYIDCISRDKSIFLTRNASEYKPQHFIFYVMLNDDLVRLQHSRDDPARNPAIAAIVVKAKRGAARVHGMAVYLVQAPRRPQIPQRPHCMKCHWKYRLSRFRDFCNIVLLHDIMLLKNTFSRWNLYYIYWRKSINV